MGADTVFALGLGRDVIIKERLHTLIALALSIALAGVCDSLGVLVMVRVIQDAAGGIFPVASAILRDECLA